MKKLLTLILILSMIFVSIVGGLSISATEYSLSDGGGISPRFTNCNVCEFTFQVLDPGEAHVLVTYVAKEDVFVQAKLTVKIQKKFLGMFWQTLTINGSHDEWCAYSYAVEDDFYKCFPIDGAGTYRAIMCLEVYGTSGTVDIIEDTIEYKYT